MFTIIAAITGDDRWERWGWSILGHMAIGWFAALLAHRDLGWQAACVLALSANYQWAGYVRKNDTVRRDLRDYQIGYMAGVVWYLMRGRS